MLSAALLGLLQALTEFLPISSSGHLRLAHAFAHYDVPDDLLFDIVLHVGTLVAVFWVYRKRIGHLLSGLFTGLGRLFGSGLQAAWEIEGFRMAALIVLATLPTGIIGVAMSGWVASDFFSTGVIGGLLFINGFILWQARGRGEEKDGAFSMTAQQALIIGIAQGIAVLPGISRSGTTIVVAMLLGVGRMRAAEFSFFLSIPAILGAVVLEFAPALIADTDGGLMLYSVGAITAAVFGVAVLSGLLGIVRSARLHRFAWYCWAIGLVALGWHLLGLG